VSLSYCWLPEGLAGATTTVPSPGGYTSTFAAADGRGTPGRAA